MSSNARDAMVNRLNERHEQLKAAQRNRAQQRSKLDGDGAVNRKMHEFLPQFLQTKASILYKLNEAVDRVAKQEIIPPSEITKLIDDIVLLMEELQKSLNDASLYLTPFDLEQGRLELKDLTNQFQFKREQLLPSKKFSFTRKPKSNPAKPPTPIKDAIPTSTPSTDSQFNPAYSVTNKQGPCTVNLPKSTEDDLFGQTIYLANLTKCTVHVHGVSGNVIARDLDQCQIYMHPVAGSVWIQDCKRTDFVLACRQLRIHQTSDSRLGLHMASRPIIEHSTNLKVAPYPIQYDKLPEDLSLAGLSANVNLWKEVEDFSCPNKRLTTGSPNWTILSEDEWPTLKPVL